MKFVLYRCSRVSGVEPDEMDEAEPGFRLAACDEGTFQDLVSLYSAPDEFQGLVTPRDEVCRGTVLEILSRARRHDVDMGEVVDALVAAASDRED